MKRKILCMLLTIAMVMLSGCGKSGSKETAASSIAGTYYSGSSSENASEQVVFGKNGSFQHTDRYKYTKELAEDKQIICMKNMDSGDEVMQISIQKHKDSYNFSQMHNGKEDMNSTGVYELKEGSDGSKETELFDGSFYNKTQDITYYFHKDGTAELAVTGTYKLSGKNLSIIPSGQKQGNQATYNLNKEEKKLSIEWSSGPKQEYILE